MGRVDVKVGFSCNNRCKFCVQGEKRSQYAPKTTAEIKAIMDEARAKTDEMVLTGGEVTIRKDLPELVAFARSLGFRVIQIQTNGRMLASNRVVDALIEAGATEFGPAIHGPNAEIHDSQTLAPGSFRQTVRGVMNVKKRGFPVLLNSVVTRLNYQHLPKMAQLFIGLKVDQFQFAFVHPLGSAGSNFAEVVPRLTDIRPYILTGLELGIRAGVRCMTEAIPLCFLPGYESHAAEWIIPRTRIVDAEWVIEDYTELRLAEGKLRGEVCQPCRHLHCCEGPWREYPEHFGWDEFQPVLEEE